jgi:hypothetical protein
MVCTKLFHHRYDAITNRGQDGSKRERPRRCVAYTIPVSIFKVCIHSGSTLKKRPRLLKNIVEHRPGQFPGKRILLARVIGTNQFNTVR